MYRCRKILEERRKMIKRGKRRKRGERKKKRKKKEELIDSPANTIIRELKKGVWIKTG